MVLSLSTQMGYAMGKFSGEDDPKNLQQMRDMGLTEIRSVRADTNGVPVLLTTAHMPDGRHLYLSYIAMGNSGVVLRLVFNHLEVNVEEGDRIWKAFVEGLNAAP
jgi:hypothetical protein